jgi:hypothetical protein
MMWFGSSSGVAISSMYREVRSTAAWLRHGWFIVPHTSLASSSCWLFIPGSRMRRQGLK